MARPRYAGLAKHMKEAMADLQAMLKRVDVTLEVRDARAPITSGNPLLEKLVAQRRRHLIVLNKTDLGDPQVYAPIAQRLQARGHPLVHCCALAPGSAAAILDAMKGMVSRNAVQQPLTTMLVMGIPNTGKSSLINALKETAGQQGRLGARRAQRGKAATGPLPGVTRTISGFQVATSPGMIYVIDSPGITQVSSVDAQRNPPP